MAFRDLFVQREALSDREEALQKDLGSFKAELKTAKAKLAELKAKAKVDADAVSEAEFKSAQQHIDELQEDISVTLRRLDNLAVGRDENDGVPKKTKKKKSSDGDKPKDKSKDKGDKPKSKDKSKGDKPKDDSKDSDGKSDKSDDSDGKSKDSVDGSDDKDDSKDKGDKPKSKDKSGNKATDNQHRRDQRQKGENMNSRYTESAFKAKFYRQIGDDLMDSVSGLRASESIYEIVEFFLGVDADFRMKLKEMVGLAAYGDFAERFYDPKVNAAGGHDELSVGELARRQQMAIDLGIEVERLFWTELFHADASGAPTNQVASPEAAAEYYKEHIAHALCYYADPKHAAFVALEEPDEEPKSKGSDGDPDGGTAPDDVDDSRNTDPADRHKPANHPTGRNRL